MAKTKINPEIENDNIDEITQSQEEAPKTIKTKKGVDEVIYKKYCDLKFISLNEGVKMKQEAIEEIQRLEAELKKCAGNIPIKTETASINHELVRLVEGIPVPDKIYKFVGKHQEAYFGK